MSELSPLYTSLSGMNVIQTKLQNLQQEITNNQTSGYKTKTQTHNTTTTNQNPTQQTQTLNQTTTQRTNHTKGPITQTNKSTDLAIDGQGYFIIQNPNDPTDTRYTQNGHFHFDQEGTLKTQNNYTVQALTKNNTLEPTNYNQQPTIQATPTTEIKLNGILNASAPQNSTYTLETKIHATNNTTPITLTFTKQLGNNWQLEITNKTTNTQITTHTLNFTGSGTITPGNEQLTLTINQQPTTITFSTPGTLTGLLGLSGPNTNISIENNGLPQGHIDQITIQPDGHLKITYTNGQTRTPQRLALTNIPLNQQNQLQEKENATYTLPNNTQTTTAHPQTNGLGIIITGALQQSNADPALQFTDLIALHNNYQANIQVTKVANETLATLYENLKWTHNTTKSTTKQNAQQYNKTCCNTPKNGHKTG